MFSVVIDVHFNMCMCRSWHFELWVDKQKLMCNLSLVQAISSLLHLSFVFDLKYVKVITFKLSVYILYQFLHQGTIQKEFSGLGRGMGFGVDRYDVH